MVIESVVKEVFDVIRVLFTGQNIIMIASTIGIFSALSRKAFKKLNERQDRILETLDKRLTNIEKETLRIQILTGIESQRLSRSELLYFFDKYKELGGNSFVEDRVRAYLKVLEDKGDD